jgi:hypothetical protein
MVALGEHSDLLILFVLLAANNAVSALRELAEHFFR